MCHPPRLGLALLTTYVALATALLDGTRTLNLEYLPISLTGQRPPQPGTETVIHPRLEDLMESNNDRTGWFADHPGSTELVNRPTAHTEDLEELALAMLADKLQGAVEDGGNTEGIPDVQRQATIQDKDLRELMDGIIQAGESETKSRLTRQAFDVRKPRDQLKMGQQGLHYLVNCRSGGLDWPPCSLFNNANTAMDHETRPDVANEEDFVVVGSDDEADSEQVTRRKRDTERQANVLPSKTRKGFSSWGGKRVPPFGSWGGKRAPDFHSWGGKRADGGLKSNKKELPNPSAWEGKRVPAFHSWGGKRATSFNSWGGKRAPSFNSWGGKRAPFNSWGGKRAPSFNSWGGKREATFNSWGGKRGPTFNSWGGKRAPSFNSWGGKRSLELYRSEDKTMPTFTIWGEKRAPFNSWGGKRAPFNSWGGKRAFDDLGENSEDRLVQPLLISTEDSELSKVNEVENAGLNLLTDGHWGGPWVGKLPWALSHFDKQTASELVTQNKPPEN